MTTSITSNPQFGFTTTAEEVASSLASQIAGKIILVTGVTPGGLGAHFVEVAAPHKPKLLILTGRSGQKLAEVAKEVESAHRGVATRTLVLDLSSQAKVRKAAEEVNSWSEPIDVLVNNAGVLANPYSMTAEGLELQFGTNHIGHFLFTNLIIDKLLATKNPRVVNVSSDCHRLSDILWDDPGFEDGKTYDKWRAYGQSKTANILFTVSLAEKLGLKGLTAFSLHPGHINTNIGRFISNEDVASLQALDKELGNKQGIDNQLGFKLKSLTQGTTTHVVAAFDPKIADHNGGYLHDAQLAPDDGLKPYAADKNSAAKLWKLSEEIVGQSFTY